MKKLLVALALALGCASASLSAQEITVSYGAYTQMDAINCHKGMDNVHAAWGSINLGLYIPVAKGVAIGPSYSYSSANSRNFTRDIEMPWGEEIQGTFHNSVGYHTIMLNAKVDYFQNSIVKLYAHAGVGAVISHMMPTFGDGWNLDL
ncbi:MAG: hypothetical protein K2M97_07250, partial [Muribaculaceae bacterium]|nr:hypothetical protein [Muribaculaceae bacterium]